MTAEPNTHQPPQPEPVPQAARNRRKLLFIVSGTAVGAALAAVSIIILTMPGSISVNGDLSLLCDSKCMQAATNGYSGYNDLSDGSQVTLVNETGKVVSTTELRRTPDEKPNIVGGVWVRTFTFTFTDVPDADRYGVHVGNSNRGTLWKNADETAREGFHLTIGS